MKARNLVMLGTKKGIFVFESLDGRRNWKSSGPHFKGTSIFHVTFDRRNNTMLAAVDDFIKGPTIARSRDFGMTWKEGKKPPRVPRGSDWSAKKIWHIEPGVEEEPEVVYCGVDPAALFKSKDGGETWALCEGLYNQQTRPKWNPGAGGLCLHSILVDPRDPETIHVAISAVGILKTIDGGESWSFKNKNLRADFLPNKYPEYGQCPHHLVRHPSRPDVIYQQNHCGEYRSDDNGETWKEMVGNLPSRFGFPIAVDFNNPKRVYVAPEESGRPASRPEDGSSYGPQTMKGGRGPRLEGVSRGGRSSPSTGRGWTPTRRTRPASTSGRARDSSSSARTEVVTGPSWRTASRQSSRSTRQARLRHELFVSSSRLVEGAKQPLIRSHCQLTHVRNYHDAIQVAAPPILPRGRFRHALLNCRGAEL